MTAGRPQAATRARTPVRATTTRTRKPAPRKAAPGARTPAKRSTTKTKAPARPSTRKTTAKPRAAATSKRAAATSKPRTPRRRSATPPPPPPSSPEPRPRRPRDVVVAVAVAVAGMGAVSLVLWAAGANWPAPARVIATELPPAAAVAALVTRWGWWRRTGWQAPVPRAGWLLWLPAVMVLAPVIVSVHVSASKGRIAAAVIAVLLIGFTEEMWFRGVFFESLLPRGMRTAVFVSAAAFGVAHLVNLPVFGVSGVAYQAMAAFASGLVWGAARARIRAIWPFVVLHAAVDFPFLVIKSAQRGTFDVPWDVVAPGLLFLLLGCVSYALVLTRPRREKPAIVAAPAPGTVVATRSNNNAIASLVCGIFGFFTGITAIPAVILGFRAKRQIDDSQGAEYGRGVAIAGIVCGFVVIGLICLIGIAGVVGSAFDTGTPSRGRPDVSINDVRVAQCYDVGSSDEIYIASCAGKHDGQVIWRGNVPSATGKYPGDKFVDKWSHDTCVEALTRFMTSRHAYGYDPDIWSPDRDTWKDGDHLLVCAAIRY